MLDGIPGVGEQRKKLLLKHFGSVKKMKEASAEDIRKLGIPLKTAQTLIEEALKK